MRLLEEEHVVDPLPANDFRFGQDNSEVNAHDNTGTNPEADPVGVPIYLLDDTWMARSNTDLWTENANPFTSVDLSELGTLLTPLPDDTFGDHVRVFTGTNRLGSATSWPVGNASVTYGAADKGDVSWFAFRRAGATNEYPIYAMSGVLTVPEPVGDVSLIAAFMLFILHFTRRRPFAAFVVVACTASGLQP